MDYLKFAIPESDNHAVLEPKLWVEQLRRGVLLVESDHIIRYGEIADKLDLNCRASSDPAEIAKAVQYLRRNIVPILEDTGMTRDEIEDIEAVTSIEVYPDLISNNIEIMYSDSAQIKLKVIASKLLRFENKEEPYTEFPEGIKVIFYSGDNTIDATITSLYAIYHEKDELWEARKDVVVMNNKSIYKMILEGDDIKWQSVIYELVRAGKVDPWDLEISTLTNEFIKLLKNLERMNFHLSGKIVLAAALLLKLKTKELGLTELLSLVDYVEAPEIEFEESEDEQLTEIVKAREYNRKAPPKLQPNIPGPRIRKVTVFELVSALKKAIDVEEKREEKLKERVEEAKPKKHKVNTITIESQIMKVYAKLKDLHFASKSRTVEFSKLIPSESKKDKVWTFVPLLHLANQDKIQLHQEIPFGKIWIEVNKKA